MELETRFLSGCFVAFLHNFSRKLGNAAATDCYFSALQIVEVLGKVAVGSAIETEGGETQASNLRVQIRLSNNNTCWSLFRIGSIGY